MSGLIPILILGTLILVFGGRLLLQGSRRNDTPTMTTEDYSAASGMLDSVFEGALATKRIFAPEDLEFIARTGMRDVQQFFTRERSNLARQWLRMTQKQMARIMHLHLRLASYTTDPGPKFEIGLTVRYACFILASNALLILIWLRGPFEAARITGYTLGMAEHFCSALSVRLKTIDSAKLDQG